MFSPGPIAQHAIMKAQAIRNFLLPETLAGYGSAGSSDEEPSRAIPIDPSLHWLRGCAVSSKQPNEFTAALSCESMLPAQRS
jgi:hypothetical protein